jgi:hypothetical protein
MDSIVLILLNVIDKDIMNLKEINLTKAFERESGTGCSANQDGTERSGSSGSSGSSFLIITA